MTEVKKIDGLFQLCFEASEQKDLIRRSHLPFANGFYVTEYDIVLLVKRPEIYRWETAGWVKASQYFALWYDSMDDFADIPPQVAAELGLGKVEFCADTVV